VVGRYGGEEFIAYMSQVGHEDAFLVGEKLRKAVERESIDGIGVTISVGMCCGSLSMDDDVAKTLSDFIGAADTCLYEAKKNGRNRVVVTSRSAT
jgi:diguanylate cyclase (GGDEF)-like protein